MSHLAVLSPHNRHYPGELIVASLPHGGRLPLEMQVLENYLPGLASSFHRFGKDVDIPTLSQRICANSSPGASINMVADILELMLLHISKTRNHDDLHLQQKLLKWLAKCAALELDSRYPWSQNFPKTLNRFRSLVAISNALASEYLASILYEFFTVSGFGRNMCSRCSKKAAFRFALLLFSLRLLPDRDVLRCFRIIIDSNPEIFSNGGIQLRRFANPRSHDIMRLMKWVGGHWDADSFDGLPEGLSSVLHARRRQPEYDHRNRWLSPLRGDLSRERDVLLRPRLQPRLYSTGSLDGRIRSANALDELVDQFQSIDSRLARLERGQDEILYSQDDVANQLERGRYERDSDEESFFDNI